MAPAIRAPPHARKRDPGANLGTSRRSTRNQHRGGRPDPRRPQSGRCPSRGLGHRRHPRHRSGP
eukprot:5919535-Heterocapsa_arctica.AAC.1